MTHRMATAITPRKSNPKSMRVDLHGNRVPDPSCEPLARRRTGRHPKLHSFDTVRKIGELRRAKRRRQARLRAIGTRGMLPEALSAGRRESGIGSPTSLIARELSPWRNLRHASEDRVLRAL